MANEKWILFTSERATKQSLVMVYNIASLKNQWTSEKFKYKNRVNKRRKRYIICGNIS